jgi:hypothetical protein
MNDLGYTRKHSRTIDFTKANQKDFRAGLLEQLILKNNQTKIMGRTVNEKSSGVCKGFVLGDSNEDQLFVKLEDVVYAPDKSIEPWVVFNYILLEVLGLGAKTQIEFLPYVNEEGELIFKCFIASSSLNYSKNGKKRELIYPTLEGDVPLLVDFLENHGLILDIIPDKINNGRNFCFLNKENKKKLKIIDFLPGITHQESINEVIQENDGQYKNISNAKWFEMLAANTKLKNIDGDKADFPFCFVYALKKLHELYQNQLQFFDGETKNAFSKFFGTFITNGSFANYTKLVNNLLERNKISQNNEARDKIPAVSSLEEIPQLLQKYGIENKPTVTYDIENMVAQHKGDWSVADLNDSISDISQNQVNVTNPNQVQQPQLLNIEHIKQEPIQGTIQDTAPKEQPKEQKKEKRGFCQKLFSPCSTKQGKPKKQEQKKGGWLSRLFCCGKQTKNKKFK